MKRKTWKINTISWAPSVGQTNCFQVVLISKLWEITQFMESLSFLRNLMTSWCTQDSKLQISVKNLNRHATQETGSRESSMRPMLSFQNTRKPSKVRRKRSSRSNIDPNKQLLSLNRCLDRVKPSLTLLLHLSYTEKASPSSFERLFLKTMSLPIRFLNLVKISLEL